MDNIKKIYENIKNKIKSNKKLTVIISSALVLLLFGTILLSINANKQKDLTPKVFKSKEYTSLPKKAQNYIKDIYKRTGQVIKTEKSKKGSEPYLNPAYIEYLTNNKDNKYGYIPTPIINDVDLSKEKVGDTNLPSKYDSRNVDGKNYVTSIKDQGKYAICWDFALTSVLETKILKENMYSGTGQIDLSERQIDYAKASPALAVDIGRNPFYKDFSHNRTLGEAASAYSYFSAVSQGISPIKESDWTPGYDTGDVGNQSRQSPQLVWNTEKTTYDVDEAYILSTSEGELPTDVINILKNKVMENGSMTILVRMPETQEEIRNGKKQYIEYSTTETLFYRAPNASQYNHEITIIGWDDTYEKNICVSPDGWLSKPSSNNTCSSGTTKKTIKGAWITKNSYGSDLSNPYVAYQTSAEEFETINQVSEKNWDNIYTGEIEQSEQTFTKQKTKEKVNKIRFGAMFGGNDANVYVSTTGEDKDYQQVGTIDENFSGVYTLDVSDKNIILDKDKFKVKVEIEPGIITIPGITVMTNNVDTDIEIDIDNAVYEPNTANEILLSGVSRNLKNNQLIDFTVTDAAGEDVTNKFSFDRNYEVSNHINTIVGFGDDVADGNYSVTAKVNGTEYDEFNLNINRVPDTVPVTNVAFDVNKIKLSVQVDNTYQLQTTISPSNASNKNVTYVSSDKSVATVDQTGKVTAVGVGTATISAISVSGAKTATCEVTVDDLLVLGDMNGDKKVNIADVARLYRHVKGINTITNPRRLKCGLLVSESSPAIADVEELYRRVKSGE